MDKLHILYSKYLEYESIFPVQDPSDPPYFKKINIPPLNLLDFETKQKLTTDELLSIVNSYATPDILESFFGGIFRNQVFVYMFSWSIPSLESLNEVERFVDSDVILEIGSGLGLWAALLR